MRTVLNRSAGRASFILVSAWMVGSAAFPAVPVFARAAATPHARAATHQSSGHGCSARHVGSVRLGPAVAFVRGNNGAVRRIR
jgi:hypothetical protein